MQQSIRTTNNFHILCHADDFTDINPPRFHQACQFDGYIGSPIVTSIDYMTVNCVPVTVWNI